MPKGVTCSVSNCTFWKEGNNCGADAISVEIDQHADFNEEFGADDLGLYHQDQATTSPATCCHTFKPKE
ncbi:MULTISPECIES: DUF1540 domain-containing protein [unclassified Paenibacillus]|uniref:DUF1540 domain-containing protein n=1 Tax=unclassified Paenibacillus TaxID=185978 RepID=UPI0010540844|nr:MULTISPECIES: DUF1540 domain-containing protein [unclassified Paenibacillus]NIK67553.1 hypothetical protein [Paenibacillus sp. BK720]TCN01594.1 uncharacterized protein DUF1540 [Paenibacillus sp. BK033]